MIATDTFYSSEPHSSESWNLNRRNHITLTVSTAVIIAVDTSNTLFSTRMPLWSWPQKEVQASSQELFCLALVLQWCKAAENPGPYFTVVLCTDLVPTAAALCKQSSVWKERELVILCNLCVKPCTFCLFGGLRGLGGSWTCVISVKFCKFCLFLCGTEAAGRTLTAILFMNECAKDCNLNACANFEDCFWKQECPFHHDFHIWMDALPFLFMPL